MDLTWLALGLTFFVALVSVAFWFTQVQQKRLDSSLGAAAQSISADEIAPADKQLALLRQYHDQGLSQSRTSFRFSILFAALGFLTIVASLFWGYQMESQRIYAPIDEVNKTIASLLTRRAELESDIQKLAITEPSKEQDSMQTEASLAEVRGESQLLAAQAERSWRAWADITLVRNKYDENLEPDWVDRLKKSEFAEHDWPLEAETALYTQLLPNLGLEHAGVRSRYINETRHQELATIAGEEDRRRFRQWQSDLAQALSRPIPPEMEQSNYDDLTDQQLKLINQFEQRDWSVDPVLPDMIEIESKLDDLTTDIRTAVTAERARKLQLELETSIRKGLASRSKIIAAEQAEREQMIKTEQRAKQTEKLNGELAKLAQELSQAEERRQQASESVASAETSSIWQSQGSVLGLIAGAIVEAVSALFFVQSNRSRELMVQFFDRLRSDRRFDESMKLVDDIADNTLQDTTRRELALGLSDLAPQE